MTVPSGTQIGVLLLCADTKKLLLNYLKDIKWWTVLKYKTPPAAENFEKNDHTIPYKNLMYLI